jgi:hypothetical protein
MGGLPFEEMTELVDPLGEVEMGTVVADTSEIDVVALLLGGVYIGGFPFEEAIELVDSVEEVKEPFSSGVYVTRPPVEETVELVDPAEEVKADPEIGVPDPGGVYVGGPPLGEIVELIEYVVEVEDPTPGGVYIGGPPLEVMNELVSPVEEVEVRAVEDEVAVPLAVAGVGPYEVNAELLLSKLSVLRVTVFVEICDETIELPADRVVNTEVVDI